VIFKLTRKAKRLKELETVVIKASKDLQTKEGLLEKFKSKADQFDKQYKELKSETDQKIEELESEMEKILQEQRDTSTANKKIIDELQLQLQNLKKD